MRARQAMTAAAVLLATVLCVGALAVLVALDRRGLAFWTGDQPPARRIH